jgi:hypothetical protein
MRALPGLLLGALTLAIGVVPGEAAAPKTAPLAGLVVPRAELGRLVAGLQVELISGTISNARAAEESFDPKDTATSLAKAGRLDGFRLFYGDLGLTALRRGSGHLDIGTSLDYFKSAKQATAYVGKVLGDVRRVRGQSLDGVVVERVGTFRVRGLGRAAIGIRILQRIGNKPIYSTYVDFQLGRLIGEAAVRRADGAPAETEAIAIAQLLASRILRYTRGQFTPQPVRLPRPLGASRPGKGAPNLQSMVLETKDVKPAIVILQGFAADDNAIASYFRQFRLDPRLGLFLLRSSAALVRSREEAAGRMLLLRATFGGPEAAETLAGFVTQGATAARLDGPVRGAGIGDESFRVGVTFNAAGQRLRAVLVHARRDRVIGTLIAVGTPKGLTDARIGGYGRGIEKAMKRGSEKPKLAA